MISAITYAPQLSVILFKTIARDAVVAGVPVSERYSNLSKGSDEIDLTPYLGDSGGVRTTKGVTEPAGGFTITIPDQPLPETLDTLYAAIEPMDMVEIRMASGPYSGKMPIVMRGFVSEVQREESVGSDGRPSRRVVISGQDYGKIWQQLQILPLAEKLFNPDGESRFYMRVLSKFNMTGTTTLTVHEFASGVIAGALNEALGKIIPAVLASRVPTEVKTTGIFVEGQRVSIQGLSQFTAGTLYRLLRDYCDIGVFNELYLEDREDSVVCMLRPRPLIDLATGQFIQPVPGFASALPDQTPGYPATGSSSTPAAQSGASAAGQLRYQATMDTAGALQDKAQALLNAASLTADPSTAAALKAQANGLLAQVADLTSTAKAALSADMAANAAVVANAPTDPVVPASVVEVQMADVQSMRLRRTDANVANFYYTTAPRFDLDRLAQLQVFQIMVERESVDFRAYPNSSNQLYGDREMESEVGTWPDEVLQGTSGPKKEQIATDEAHWTNYLRDRRVVLSSQNKDNVVFESGTMRLRGRPDIKAGMYIRITRGGVESIAYVTHVDHEFIPFMSFYTSITFERGTGFVERLKSTRNLFDMERL